MADKLNITDILGATFGESSSKIRATYKKTVNIRQYETEVVELETTLDIEEPLTGAERMIISAALQIQLEYTVYCQLSFKGLVTQSELQTRVAELEQGLNALKSGAEVILKKPLDHYFKSNIL